MNIWVVFIFRLFQMTLLCLYPHKFCWTQVFLFDWDVIAIQGVPCVDLIPYVFPYDYTMEVAHASITSYGYDFCFVVRTRKIWPLSDFRVYNTVSLTVVTVPCVTPPGPTYLLTGSLDCLTNISSSLGHLPGKMTYGSYDNFFPSLSRSCHTIFESHCVILRAHWHARTRLPSVCAGTCYRLVFWVEFSYECQVLSPFGFHLHFPSDRCCWASLHVLVGHLFIFFGECLLISWYLFISLPTF